MYFVEVLFTYGADLYSGPLHTSCFGIDWLIAFGFRASQLRCT